MTAKEIVSDIMRQKYATDNPDDLAVMVSKFVADNLRNTGLICAWKDYYPGVIVNNLTICGLPLCVDEALLSDERKCIGYEIIGQEEWGRRESSVMKQRLDKIRRETARPE